MNLTPFIDGSYGVTTAFLLAIGLLTYRALQTRGQAPARG